MWVRKSNQINPIKKILCFSEHRSFAKFCHRDRFILFSTLDNTTRIWDLTQSQVRKTYSNHVNEKYCMFLDVLKLNLSSESSSSSSSNKRKDFLITGSEDNNIIVYDLLKRNIFQKIKGHTGMCFSFL